MAYIYLDESGDLGFSPKGSKYFIISCVKIESDEIQAKFSRIPRKVRKKLFKKKQKTMPELKFSNSSQTVRKLFLELSSNLPIEVYSLIVEKKHTKKELQDNLK